MLCTVCVSSMNMCFVPSVCLLWTGALCCLHVFYRQVLCTVCMFSIVRCFVLSACPIGRCFVLSTYFLWTGALYCLCILYGQMFCTVCPLLAGALYCLCIIYGQLLCTVCVSSMDRCFVLWSVGVFDINMIGREIDSAANFELRNVGHRHGHRRSTFYLRTLSSLCILMTYPEHPTTVI